MKIVSLRSLGRFAALEAASAAVMLLYPALTGLGYSRRALGDGLGVAGIFLLVMGLFRLVNRMGLVDGIKEPAKVEKELWKIIPPDEGSDFCHRLVYHGREVCTARTKPHCERCCLQDICKKAGV